MARCSTTNSIGGIAGALLILYGFSRLTEVSAAAMRVTTMLGLGLAVDYALLILTRFREERGEGAEVTEAVRRTVATAGRTVLFSGLTVAACLAGLLVFPAPALRSIGMAAAAVIVVDMLATVTLLRALLTRFGGTIPPRVVAADGGFFARIARSCTRRPIAGLLIVGAALAVLALPATGMKLADADARSLPHRSESRQMYDALTTHFPAASSSSPVTVILRPGADPGRAVVDGLSRTGRVVTCAALLLVPATMALLGSRAWWAPAPMRRLHARFGVREEAEQVPATGPRAGARV
ncbi:hypothetical protein GCM10023191_062370 [Actinoallomurus oryzae]|uniref:SSD domain-containing protein n=1 Tax=Actinoallomurus oryzae TaxID=502180 RepID=A0ABP8QP17_9ACTN